MENNVPHFLNDPNWMPVQFRFENEQAEIRWMYFGNIFFHEPFFDDTIIRCKQLPENNQIVWTSIDVLLRLADVADCIQPDVFIFHVSRCGSTLLSQAFALRQDCIVLSEVPLFDQLLRFSLRSDAHVHAWYVAAVRLLGRKRTMQKNILLVKCDSWHVFFYQRIRGMFPRAAVSLLTRAPEEVFQSQLKSPGLHAVHGMLEPELFHLNRAELNTLHPHHYLAHVLEFYQRQFAEILQHDATVHLQDYADGADRLIAEMAALLQLPQDEHWMQEIKTRFQFHSKRPEQKFEKELHAEIIPEAILPAIQAYRQLIQAHKKT